MNARRQEWVDFICDPSRPARYLSGLGDTAGIQIHPIDDDTFNAFIAKLSQKGSNRRTLIDALDYTFGGYHDFFSQQLKELLRGLAHESFNEQEVQGPSLRGKINWPATLVARAAARLSDGRFIVRRTEKSFDLPENQLLKLLVATCASDLDRMTASIGTGALHASLLSLRRLAESGLRDFRLRTVSKEPRVRPDMLARAGLHRNAAYREVARLAKRRQSVSDALNIGRLEAILSMLRCGWLAPVDDDNLFEAYALALTLDVLSKECGFGEPVEYGLVVSGRRHIASFRNGDLSAYVYFDQTPAMLFGLQTRYADVLSTWQGVSGGERRPDITVHFKCGKFEHILIIEVKRSDDDRYRRDSLYKVFGYLYDFHKLWAESNLPRAVLIFPSAIEPRSGPPVDLSLRLVSGEKRDQLAEVLKTVVLSSQS